MVDLEAKYLLHAVFDAQANRTPHRVAAYFGEESISYSELADRANRTAGSLRDRGIREGAIVGVHIERSIDWLVTILAVLKTNAAVLPLPPAFPRERLESIVSFANMNAIVDNASAPETLAVHAPVWQFPDLQQGPERTLDAEPGVSDQQAFVLCSSGSTGTPKLIVRSHRSFFHRLTWTWTTHPYGDDEVCCQKSHMTTTHAIYELFEPLLQGTPVVVIPDSVTRDLESFWETIRRREITRLLIVPSALRASLEILGPAIENLRTVVLMGEYVDRGLVDQLLEIFPRDTHLYSIYGSTEASSTLLCDLRQSCPEGAELPLGHPLTEDIEIRVLDADGNPVVAGQTGRLYIEGTALFDQYLNDPESTRSSFLRSSNPEERLYDTRDEVRLLPGRQIEYIGRVDHTIKIRGFRVNTQEVEHALRAVPGVDDAVVLSREGAATGAVLLGFVSPASVEKSELLAALKEMLPDYMIPSSISAEDTFPRTSSGKIDRQQLLQRRSVASPDGLDDASLSPTEKLVREEWVQLLGHDDFGLDESFFEVGGTSLVVFALILRLRERLGLETDRLGAQFMYTYPSVRASARHIDDIRGGLVQESAPEIPTLVTLRTGSKPDLPPFFLVASAGGTLGAYEKLVRALEVERDVIGVRDPFLWDKRDPTAGFQHWVQCYLDAIRARQPEGPYYIGAYSSAGAFGYEIARQLLLRGEKIALLVLLDPLGIDCRYTRRFGYWARRTMYMSPLRRRIVRVAGHARIPFVWLWRRLRPPLVNDQRWSPESFELLASEVKRDKSEVMTLAALLELNTGLRFELSEADLEDVPPDEYLQVLQSRAEKLAPGFDMDSLEHLLVQYQLQARAQHAYQLQPLKCPVLLVEPRTAYAGILASHIRPHVPRLKRLVLELDEPSARIRQISRHFGSLADHYRSVRGDMYARDLAKHLSSLLN